MTHLLSWEPGLQSDNFLFNGQQSRLPSGQHFIFSLNQGRLPFRNSCPAVWLNLAHKSKNCLAVFIRGALPALLCRVLLMESCLNSYNHFNHSFVIGSRLTERQKYINCYQQSSVGCIQTAWLVPVTVGRERERASEKTKTTKFV